MATQLDQATRDAVMAEANARAQRLGISPEQALYNYARENNISNADVDTYMGYAPGSADAWVRQRDAANAVTHPNTIALVQIFSIFGHRLCNNHGYIRLSSNGNKYKHHYQNINQSIGSYEKKKKKKK